MAVGESSTDIVARREGFVVPWEGLTQDQRLVVQRAAEILASMSRESEPQRRPSGPNFLPAIDHMRTNRVLFIDGKRGSGKSSVLVSIIDSYSELIRDRQTDGALGYRDVIRRDSNIVPIGLLDLDPLQGVSNLLLQVITCFAEVVRAVCGGDEVPSRSILDEVKTHPVMTMWQQLRLMVARTWVSPKTADGVTEVREHVWNELEAADERARVHSVFSSFMDLLCAEYADRYRTARLPMFVMAFDDVDMNSELSHGLLAIVRSFRHSRLAFVLTGDGDLLLRRVAVAVSDDEQAFTRTRSAKPRSSVLAEEVVRKIIPPHQRLVLRELTVAERVVLLPELRAGLERVTCNYRGQSESLLSKVRRYERPFGTSFLPDRLRELVDFTSSVVGKVNVRAFLPILADRWRLLAEREGLRAKALSYDSAAGALLVDPSELKIQAVPEHRHRYRIDVLRSAEISVLREYRLQIADKTASVSLSALFFLVVDLLTEDEGLGSGVDTWLRSQRISESGAEVYLSLPRGWVRCEWPSVKWLRMIEHQTFAGKWEQTVGALIGREEPNHDMLLRAFLGLVLTHCENATREAGGESSAPTWQQLGTRIVQLFGSPPSAQPDFYRWVVRDALLFASPELCPNEAGAQVYLATLSRLPLFGSMTAMAKASRLEWYLVVGNSAEGEALAESMREFAPSHPWWEYVDSASKANPEHIRRLNVIYEIMERAPIQFKEFGGSRLSLANYVTDSRRRLILQGGGASLERAEGALSALRSVSKWSGSALHSIMALWKSFLGDAGAFLKWLSIENDGLKFSAEARSAVLAVHSSYTKNAAPEGYSQVGRVELSRVPDPALRLIPRIPAAAEAILRIAWDYESDRLSTVSEDHSSALHWPHCRYRIDGVSLYPWPLPNWPQIWPWERYGEIWNGIVDSDRNVVSHTNSNIPADALALALIRATGAWSVLMSGSDSVDWTWQEGLALAVRQAADQLGEPVSHGRLRMVYREWLESLILFATPEAGLAPQVAEQFITVLGPIMLKLCGVDGILAKRRELNASVPDVAKLLARIDRQNNSHPWVIAFGRHEKKSE